MALGQLVIDLNLNLANFVSGIGKTNQSLGTLQKSVKAISGASFVYLGRQALEAAQNIYGFTKSIAISANEIERNSKTIGISISGYQKLAYAAKMSDVEMESVMVGMKKLSQSMDDAAKGTGTAGNTFKSLGIDIRDQVTGGLVPLDEMLLKISDSLANVSDPAQKLSVTLDLMGRGGMALTPLFNEGRKAIENFYKAAEKSGKILSDDIIKTGSEADKVFKDFEQTLKATKLTLTPLSLEFARFFTDILWGANQTAGVYTKYVVPWLEDWGIRIKTLGEKWMELGERLGVVQTPKIVIPTLPKEAERLWTKKPTITPYITSPEQYKAVAKAMEDIVEQNYKLGDLYEYDKNMLAATVREADNLNEVTSKTRAIMEQVAKITGNWQNYFKQGKLTAWEYVDAIKAVKDQLEDLTTRDQQISDKKLQAEEDYRDAIKAIPQDAEDRQKRVSKAFDEWLKKIKEAEKIKLPTYLDVEIAQRELNEFIKKAESKGIILPVTTQTPAGGGGGTITRTPTETWGGPTDTIIMDFENMGKSIDRVSQQIQDVESRGMTIPIYGEGSSRKPITDKIREIIAEFGGIEKTVKGIEANISFQEASAEVLKFQTKLKGIESVLGGLVDAVQLTQRGWQIFGNLSYPQQVQAMMILDVKSAMETAKLKMLESTVGGYVGSMQSGGVVSRTGLYKLHEGERVTSKSVSMGNININLPTGSSKEQAKEIAKQLALIIKYKQSGDLAEYV